MNCLYELMTGKKLRENIREKPFMKKYSSKLKVFLMLYLSCSIARGLNATLWF